MNIKIQYKTIFVIVLLLLSGSLYAQDFRLELSISDAPNESIHLAHYYGGKVLKIDSTRLDNNGFGTIEREKKVSPGIYIIYQDEQHFVDFLVDNDQNFAISIAFDSAKPKTISGAKESEAFEYYQEFLRKQRQKQLRLQKQLQQPDVKPDSAKAIRHQLKQMNEEMEQFWRHESDIHDGTFYADFLRAMIIPRPGEMTIPPGTRNPDSLRWALNYKFRRDHYWDEFNFEQGGLIRTPLIQSRLDNYTTKILMQNPDSVLIPTLKLIEKSRANNEMFRYIAGHLITQTANSNVMGMDKVFVAIADAFYLNGEASWADSTTLAKIAEKVYLTRPNMVGNSAPDLKLPDEEGIYHSLQQVNAEYTILYFWEPNCNHCNKSTPELYQSVFLPLQNQGVKVFAVCTQDNKEEWLEFIHKHQLYEWTNLWDPEHLSNFHALYDVHSTPTLYLLDKQKTIIAKRLDVKTTGDYLHHLLSVDKH